MEPSQVPFDDFPRLKRKIGTLVGLDLRDYKESYLRRRLAVCIRARGAASLREYAVILERDTVERSRLLDELTINVTEFFRDPVVFRTLEEEILPAILGQKLASHRRIVRLWSAGCAGGEEAYSLAILLLELLGDQASTFLVSVQGTDLDACCIRAAKQGTYPISQLRNLERDRLERFFEIQGETCTVRPEVRRIVRFHAQDISREPPGGHFDLITFRNVAIYFAKDAQERLFTALHGALNERGYLVIGRTEMLTGPARDRFQTIDAEARIFQKPGPLRR